ncbi:MogA/MoaB family molybdenum cofactor biosynthesis protein [Hoyosella sp. G463]|uniref:MogA/MoaB family molybdenum cofactor biosynthesis protein n=1 Tax=Lolliginicoccus lacisalsi TaxID=2742202 RepID=A0A927JBX4_9ACTN|nr:MogA/MoaB family molybdenum cofactor biosynthesis protein [Lolliginicoccus lacisalsi]MBD8505832.1 MogA/MoaB family molybdenum cofactor biosynthesis protein [Lolliginicoccus lacisalsi]
MKAAVIVASTRAAAGTYTDRTGPLIAEWLQGRGFAVGDPTVVADGEPVAHALRDALDSGCGVILTTGGTGLSPTDTTPQHTAALLDYEIPGIAETLRQSAGARVPTAILSRGIAGIAGRTLIVNLPGSRGGVKDGLAILDPILEHALDQIQGHGNHD